MTQSNGQAGTQRPNKQDRSRPMNALIDKTKNLEQTQAMQTLAPTPYTKEQTPTQHNNPRTQFLNNNRNDNIQIFLQGFTPTASTNYSLWKTIKITKQITKSSPSQWVAQGT
jgi:hypothetical protein